MRGSTIVLVLLPSSSITCIVVSGPSVTPLVMEWLLIERPYCSVISRATASLIIVKLGSLWNLEPCVTNVIASFTSIPDISTVEGWVPGPKVIRY